MPNEAVSEIMKDSRLNFSDKKVWEEGMFSVPHRQPKAILGSQARHEVMELWIKAVAKIPQDNKQAGVFMREHHQELQTEYYVENDKVYQEYSFTVLVDALAYRSLVKLAKITPGQTVLDVACGVGTIGELAMDMLRRVAPGSEKKVYFADASGKMLECARNRIISRFGQPPAKQSRFQVCNVLMPDGCAELKAMFGQAGGFDVVIAGRFLNHFPLNSLRSWIAAMMSLVAPGGKLVFDFDIPSDYELIDEDGPQELVVLGGVMEIDGRPIAAEYPKSTPTMTGTTPVIQGINANSPHIIGEDYPTEYDLAKARRLVEKAVAGISNTRTGFVEWNLERKHFRNVTAKIDD